MTEGSPYALDFGVRIITPSHGLVLFCHQTLQVRAYNPVSERTPLPTRF